MLLRDFAEFGGLLPNGLAERVGTASSGPNDRILKGVAGGPAVEQPTKFDLVINMRTAKARASPPPSLLLRADHVIE